MIFCYEGTHACKGTHACEGVHTQTHTHTLARCEGMCACACVQGPRNLGSGHAMAQLGWAGHAYTIGPEGLHQPVELPVLELLQSRKVQ